MVNLSWHWRWPGPLPSARASPGGDFRQAAALKNHIKTKMLPDESLCTITLFFIGAILKNQKIRFCLLLVRTCTNSKHKKIGAIAITAGQAG